MTDNKPIDIKTNYALSRSTIAFVQRGLGYLTITPDYTMSDGEHTFVFRGRIRVIEPPKIVGINTDVSTDDER